MSKSNMLLKNVVYLVGGTSFAQLITIVVSPFLTRLYEPSEFGSFTLFASVVAIISIVSCLAYEQAITLPKTNRAALNILFVAIVCVVCISVGSFGLLWLGKNLSFLPQFYEKVGGAWWAISLCVLMTGLFMSFNFWSIRSNKFVPISVAKVAQTLFQAAIQLSLSSFSFVGLIVGYVVGSFSSIVVLVYFNIRSLKYRAVSFNRMVSQAYRYKRFPAYSVWEVFLNAASLHMAPIIFAVYFSTAYAGLYAIAYRIIALPMTVVGTAVGQGIYSQAQEFRSGTEGSQIIAGVVDKVSRLAILPTLIIIFYGPVLFGFVFGEQWREAGELGRWISVWLFFQIVASPLSAIYPILERQREGLLWQVLLICSRVITLVIGIFYEDFGLTIILYALASAACYLVLLYRVAYIVTGGFFDIFKRVISQTYIVILSFSPLLAAALLVDINIWVQLVLHLITFSCLLKIYSAELRMLLKKLA